MSVYTGPGTISISGTAVTGSGTTFQASGVKVGALLVAGVQVGVVAAVNSDTSLTLYESWSGGSVSGSSDYTIVTIDSVTALLRLNTLLSTIETNLANMLLSTGSAYAARVNVASATACDIGGAASYLVNITGTTTITSCSNMANKVRWGVFAAGLTLTHSSALQLPGAANIATAAGDRFIAIGDASGNCTVYYTRANGVPVANASAFRSTFALPEVLTAGRTYYVNDATGSDSANDGLSAGAPFKTLTKAVAVVAGLFLGGYTVTISVAAGTYTAVVTLPSLTAGGSCAIIGDEATPANVTVNVAGNHCFYADGASGVWQLRGMKVVGAYGIRAHNNAQVKFQNIDFGACSVAQIHANRGARIEATGNYRISGGGLLHMQAVYGASVHTAARTVTISNTPAFTYAFANAASAFLEAHSMTFAGTGATGKRYIVGGNGAIVVAGGGANYFPGDIAGTASADGEYA